MTSHRLSFMWIKIFALLYLGASLQGCVSATPRQMTADFGGAAKTLAEQTETTLKGMRTSISDFQLSSLLYGNEIRYLSPPSLTQKEIEVRLTPLREIAKYGNALLIMSGDNEPERIDKASRDLYGSLGALNKNIQERGNSALISDGDLQLIATITNIGGRWVFERMRLKALRTSVKIADPALQKGIALLQEDIRMDEGWISLTEASLEAGAKNFYALARSLPASNIAERRNLFAEARRLFEQSTTVKQTIAQLDASLRKLSTAHSALLAALENDSDVNIRNALGTLSALENELIRIEAFRASISNTGKD